MQPLYITYLNGPDIEGLGLTDADILHAVEGSLDAQGRKATVIEPRVASGASEFHRLGTSMCYGASCIPGPCRRQGGRRFREQP